MTMKGNNRLILNTATVKEAIQYWLEQKVFIKSEKHPKVTNIEPLKSGFRDDGMFEISLSSDEAGERG